MRLYDIHKEYLYEGLDHSRKNTAMLWESAGRKIMEAELTADQINQLFAAVEKGATDAGGNRTMLGKGKDAAEAVNKAWEDLKTKVQNSGPIKNVDSAYDSAVAKIEAGLGGPDNAVNKVIQKYRQFAKEHPIAQGLIYSALIAAAGISGAGLGGAAVLGLLKMTDKLLQGEKFSSAAYSGAKTGAMAYGASKIGDMIRGKPEADMSPDDIKAAADSVAPVSDQGLDASLMQKNADMMKSAAKNAYHDGTPLDAVGNMSAATARAAKNLSPEQLNFLTNLGKNGTKMVIQDNGLWYQTADGTMEVLRGTSKVGVEQMLAIAQAAGKQALKQSYKDTRPALTEAQIDKLIYIASRVKLNEGPLDAIKGAAGKAVDWAKTKGHNLTTKVTADKLKQAWTKAGSPTEIGRAHV